MTRRLALYVPLALFGVFLMLVLFGLGRSPETVIKSTMIGKPVPEIALPGPNGRPGLATADLRGGKPVLVNVFASWCIPCAAEAPQLIALKQAGVTIHGVAIRDRPEDIAKFLSRYGDPYARIGLDDRSSMQIALGSAGVPESFVVDGKGVIRLQHIGDIRAEHIPRILAALEAAR